MRTGISAFVGLAALVTMGITLAGCPVVDGEGIFTFSDGAIVGINGYEGLVEGVIDVSPNSGGAGTPVTVLIRFTRGADLVANVYEFDATPVSGNEFFLNREIGYTQINPTTWQAYSIRGAGVGLTGNDGVIRFYAVNTRDEAIGVGDAYVNAGRSLNVPSWNADGIGKAYSFIKAAAHYSIDSVCDCLGLSDTSLENE